MKEVITEIARALVDEPQAVEVEESVGEHTCVLKLKVAKNDIGKIIGKRGANANAIRTLLDASGGKSNRRFILEIVE
ncbi:MAG: KH domain-containing protein [Bdellovibrionota bacterium]|nr:KH domain-containing protein [Deltaproteobacteria bacterium]